MTDAQYLQEFEAGRISPGDFSHRMHIRVARELLIEAGPDDALPRLRAGLRTILAKIENPEGPGYHETLTVAWLRVVQSALLRNSGEDFEAFAGTHPELMNSGLIFDFYDRSILDDSEAREIFVPPACLPLPADRPPIQG